MSRDYGVELDALRKQISELERLVRQTMEIPEKQAVERGQVQPSTEACMDHKLD